MPVWGSALHGGLVLERSRGQPSIVRGTGIYPWLLEKSAETSEISHSRTKLSVFFILKMVH